MMCTASSPVLDLPRFFKLTCKQLEVKFPVSDSVWFTLDQLSKDFSVLEEEEISSELELCQLFLQFLVNFPDTNSCFLDSLKEVYEQFLLLFDPNSRGFYSALSELDAHNRLKVLNTCNKVYQVLLENNYISKTDRIPHLYASSTFFESLSRGESTLFSVFGGQGVQGLIEELRQVYTYYPVTRSFIEDMCHVLLACSRQPEVEPLGFFSRGMDVFKWLTDPLSLPSEDYLTTCFVSAPLIALVQLANYYLFIKLLNISPGEMLKHTLGLTGHSQGLASAVAVGSSATLEDFHTNSFRVLKLLFWIGFRGRQVYPPPKTPPASLGSALQVSIGLCICK
jgi:fatty acid synthase subunit alpha